MSARPGASTRLLALLGDPVSHSLSPVFQNAALRALDLDAVYVALRCSADDVPGLLRGIARAGGAGNVTVPHKEAAARAVDRPSEAVRATGACNAFWLRDGEIHGDNTDVDGVRAALGALPGGADARRVLLVGAGGAAAAVLHALCGTAVEEVVILNRTRDRAAALAGRFGSADDYRIAARSPDEGLDGERFDLAVNATSLGLKPDDPLPPTAGAEFGAALDLVYARGETRWVRELRARGLPAADGKEMLLHQGAAAFRRWWGVEPPLDVMRAALLEAAEGRGG